MNQTINTSVETKPESPSTPAGLPVADAPKGAAGGKSYGQILKSSTIIGGSSLINLALGIGRSKINALLLEMEQGPQPAGGPPPQLAQIQELGKRQAAGGMTLNLMVVVFLIFMIWKPGIQSVFIR